MQGRERTSTDDTRILLVAQLKRAIELLKNADFERFMYSKDLAELDSKLHEIRRDSIRLVKMIRNPYRFKRENS